MALSLNDVNRKGSFTWIKCNDDAKSFYFRSVFCSKYGGEFIKTGRYHEWNPEKSELILDIDLSEELKENKDSDQKKIWTFKDPQGNLIKTTNLQNFCKENELTRSSLYEVISGKRALHKGYAFIETTTE